ncbi:MAG TPA: acetate--CoA ligase family protein [Thermodesulfobacteriota bacterium]|nr:acetate--CoA ligase family protein [Thermodesulfobacteriota bacterium]
MAVKNIIDKARHEGRKALTEAESKQVLKEYGVPVVEEFAVRTPEEAAARGENLGFPVVLKGLGSKLTHKTERGAVKLNLGSREAVLRAASEISRAAGSDLEGYLVQPMIRGRREFVAGLFRDPQFGPVVMFGLGGVFTEALGDVTFRIAPLSESEAAQMIDDLRSKRLLNSFRGENAVRREEIVRTLVGLSSLAVDCPEVAETDINPLVIDAQGRVTAVDALIVLGDPVEPEPPRAHVDFQDIFKIFAPRSLAFIGASGKLGKWGNLLFTNAIAGGYEGKIYLVNPRAEAIAGRKVYRSLAEIPEDVDLGVVTVPAPAVTPLIPEFKAKGVRYMLLITSGFAETGPEGRRLERDLVRAAADAGILILGPNTMGICNPHAKFYCTGTTAWPKAGSISLVSQSGNLGTQLICFAEQEGIGIRAFCGSGNEAMITIEDFLRALEQDEATRTVVLYLESVKNGKRFLEDAARVSRRKPVVVLKGGRTDAGNRAAASHTGALASNINVFNAACRQAGIVVARQPMELLDLSAAFSSVPLPGGNRVALVTLGGGWGVVTTDACVESGLEVPPLAKNLVSMIDTLLPPYWSRTNPVDIVGEMDPSIPIKVIEALTAWEGCDAVIHLGRVGRSYML